MALSGNINTQLNMVQSHTIQSLAAPVPSTITHQHPPTLSQAPSLQLLQPEKVGLTSKPAVQSEELPMGKTSLDKEFVTELEKKLGLTEANANLMPPSPAPTTKELIYA